MWCNGIDADAGSAADVEYAPNRRRDRSALFGDPMSAVGDEGEQEFAFEARRERRALPSRRRQGGRVRGGADATRVWP
jgi:hypothetical protein